MDLRDEFAIRMAAALVAQGLDGERLPGLAYDLAEAMLEERNRRLDADEMNEAYRGGAEEAEPTAYPAPLLDVPEAWLDDQDEVVDEYDPHWDLEPQLDLIPGSRRPGLARTRPDEGPARERTG